MQARKRKALGKGLKALIPTESKTTGKADSRGFKECPIDTLVANEEQPRQSFDEQKLRELTESVRNQGILQALVVRSLGNDKYQIVAGERRWRAARLAGLKTVPVVVKELSDSEVLEVALIENLQREDLNPLEEAEAYQQLVDEHGLTQEQLAKRVGKQRSTVANSLRLLKLPSEIQNYLLTGELTMGHARAILGISGLAAQTALARKVVKDKLSVRACEELVRQQGAKTPGAKTNQKAKETTNPAEVRVVETLQRQFGTKVELKKGRRGGKLVIHYFSPGELDRILDVIEGR